MSKIRTRLIVGILLVVLLSGVFFSVLYLFNASLIIRQDLSLNLANMHDTAIELDEVDQHGTAVIESMMDRKLDKVALSANFLVGSGSAEEWDELAPVYSDDTKAEMVVKVTEDAVLTDKAAPVDLTLDPSLFTDQKGWFIKESKGTLYVVYYYRIGDESYFISWETYEDSPTGSALQERMDAIRGIEKAFGIDIIRFLAGESEGDYIPLYIPEEFEGFDSLDDFGITVEMLDEATDPRKDSFRESDPKSWEEIASSASLEIGEDVYEAFFRTTDGGKTVTVFMFPFRNSVWRAAQKSGFLLIVFLIIAVAFLAWCISARFIVVRHNLNDEQKRNFDPKAIKQRAATFVLVGAIAIGAAAVFLQCIFASFNMTVVAERSLQTVIDRLESNKERSEAYEKMRMESYQECANMIAQSVIFGVEDELPDPVDLTILCEDIGADSIIIYDETGKELVSNARYKGLTLTGSGEEMRDFRRLLNGVPAISKKSVKDEVTGLTRAVFGVSIGRFPGSGTSSSLYCALLLLVDPDQIKPPSMQSVDEIMQSVGARDTYCFSVDPDSGKILSASVPGLTGRDAAEVGLPKEALSDSFMGFFAFNRNYVYARAAQQDGVLYYYAVEWRRMFRGILPLTVSVVLLYLGLMAVLAVFLLFRYGKTFEEYASTGTDLEERENDILMPSGKIKKSVDPSRRWVFSASGYGSHTPFHNAYVAGQGVYVLSVVIIALSVMTGRLSTNNSAIAYILRGNWTRGVNLFAIANILFLFIEVSLGTILAKTLIRAVTMHLGTKGETIGRLMLNFVTYLSVIVFAYFALSYIGINTATLVASLGIITFALSLGAQDLVKDILAGLAIVFDGAYQVGDIIEVNGFRGRVLEVGVRSIKIEGRGGNIMIMGNRDVRNIINKTRKNSWYALDIRIDEQSDLSRVETILWQNLPRIGEEIPEIISGPYYKGIIDISQGKLCLSVIAECDEEDYYHVQRALNGAIVRLFVQNGIVIR